MDHKEIGSFKGQNLEERELRRKYESHMIGIIIIPKVWKRRSNSGCDVHSVVIVVTFNLCAVWRKRLAFGLLAVLDGLGA